ncbi:MAG: YcfL family protein [Verrucomicrobiales bacterium]|nr:YcfL family protein [Verrucomicrobiales bacterium]
MKSSLFSLLLLAVVAGAGCRSTQMNTVDPAQPANQREMISDKRVLKDQSLNKAVNIVGLNVGTGPEGFLKVQVEVENRTRSLKSFTYTVEWFDENGILIELPTAHSRPRSLEGGEIAAITATAPTPRAKDFRIKFLEPVGR